MKPHDDWTVLPHGDIEQIADNLYTVVGQLKMPFGTTPRRMTIARLAGERLAIYSAIALDEKRMQDLEKLGTPEFLIVPSGIHRIDAKPWKKRYPDLVVVAPDGARDRIGEVLHIDASNIDLGDPRVRIAHVPGTDRRELAMTVESNGQREASPKGDKTLVINDLIFNLPAMKGIAGWGLRILGFHPGEPSMPKLVMKKLVADDKVVRAQLRAWAEAGFDRILVAHGGPIENPRETLLALAA